MKAHPLKVAREARGWSQSKLAKTLGVNTRTVGRWELRLVMPHPHYREQLSLLFGRTIEELGLIEEVDKNDSVQEEAPSLIDEFPMLDLAEQEEYLLDSVIDKMSGSANSLLGCYGSLTQVKQCLFEGKSVVLTAADSLPGIGKTVLAAALAKDEQVQAHFCDGILWARLGQEPKILDELARWSTLLGVVPSQVENINNREAWGQALRTAIGNRCMLLIIDDVWADEHAAAFQVGGAQCTYLMTTRQPRIISTFDQQETIVIPQLEEDHGLALLARFIPQQVQQDPVGARELVRAVGGLPLALTLIGKYVVSTVSAGQSEPLRAALAQFHDTQQFLNANIVIAPRRHPFNLLESIPLPLLTTIAICDQQLNPEAYAALRALSIFPPKPNSFSKEAALVVSQKPVEVLNELCNSGLLEHWGSERYALHQTVIDYGRVQHEFLIVEQQQDHSVVDDVELHEEDNRYIARHNRYSHPSPQDIGISYHMRHVSTFRLFNCSSQSSWFIVSMIILVALVIIGLSQAFNGRSFLQKQPYASLSPTSTSLIANYRPPLYGLTIQNADPSMLKTAQNLNQVFNAVYPQLVNRFALDPTTAPKTVTLTFASNLSSVASINGATIILSANWMQQHPNDFGLLTHELTVLLEHYPSGVPGWFADGMADYARDVYGPANDDDWSLPNGVQPQNSYLQGGGIAARFLLWLEQHTTLSIVDQLNHALQAGQTFSTVFHHVTHHSVDQLWERYHSDPKLSLTPEQLYTSVTSRKPLSQISTFSLQVSQPRTFVFYTIPGIFVSNFALQADITTIQGDGGGFIFRWNNIQNNAGDPQYRIRIRPNVDKTLGNFDLAEANSVLTYTYSSAIKRGYNQTNQLTIIVHKHSLYFYVNGQFITKVDNNLSSDGIVAAMANDDSNPADVRFENVRVF
jgi:transcriptional regulator with XRE-family HTH domain